jgi:hypothetical protein
MAESFGVANYPEVRPRRPSMKALVSEYHNSASLHDIDNPWIKVLLRRPSFDELYDALICEPAEGTASEARESYMPTSEIVTTVGQVFDAIRHTLERKDFGDPTFNRYFHALGEFFSGNRKVNLPPYPAGLAGVGIRVTGVSRSGKTALLQRLRVLLGRPHYLHFHEGIQGKLCFVPMLIVRYPDCGTVKGLIAGIREQLLAQLATVDTKPTALKEMLRGDVVAEAVCACMTANVGLIAIDGASFDVITSDLVDVLKAINRLKNYTGIPIIFTATPVFMHIAAQRGSVFANLFNGPALHLSPFEAPKIERKRDGKAEDAHLASTGIWYQMCQWQFGLSRFEQGHMPQQLPAWTYAYALGRIGWLSEGFGALRAIVDSRGELTASDINEDLVTAAFHNQLDVHDGARTAIVKSWEEKSSLDDADFLCFLDHFDTHIFQSRRFRQHLNGFGMKFPKELKR